MRDLAAACAAVDPRYAAFVLTQGLSGCAPAKPKPCAGRDVHLAEG